MSKILQDSYVYKHLNTTNGISNNIASLMSTGSVLSKEQLEEPFMVIKKNYKFPLKYKIFEAIDRGSIVIMCGSTKTKLPTCLPFFLTKNADDEIVAVIVGDTYGTLDDDGGFHIEPKKLYCMMEGAYLARLIHFHDKQAMSRPSIMSCGSSIYSTMFVRVLNKKFSINTDKNKYNSIVFLASKFFMINVLGLEDSETVFNYAIKSCKNANLLILKELNSQFDTKYFDSLDTFISALSSPGNGVYLKSLTVRGYLEAYINMYDASALLSLELLPYFMYNIMGVTNGAFINNQYVLEDLVGSDGAKMYNDLLVLDK